MLRSFPENPQFRPNTLGFDKPQDGELLRNVCYQSIICFLEGH